MGAAVGSNPRSERADIETRSTVTQIGRVQEATHDPKERILKRHLHHSAGARVDEATHDPKERILKLVVSSRPAILSNRSNPRSERADIETYLLPVPLRLLWREATHAPKERILKHRTRGGVGGRGRNEATHDPKERILKQRSGAPTQSERCAKQPTIRKSGY